MTVGKLIEMLSMYNPEKQVIVTFLNGEETEIYHPKTVKIEESRIYGDAIEIVTE